MVKSLVKRIGEGAKNLFLSAIAATVLSGCPYPAPDEPDKNHAPVSTVFNINPLSGYAPLETIIESDGTDEEGKSDIVKYEIGEDKNDDRDIDDYNEIIKSSSNPINEQVIFSSPGVKKIYTQLTDTKGAVGKAGPIIVNVLSVPDDPDDPDDPDEPYDPSVDLSGIPSSEKNFNEESQTTMNLPTPYDPNPEDNPVPYRNATSLNGKVSLDTSRLDGNILTITGNEDATGIYQIEFEFGTPEGGISTAILEGEIYNLIDLSGRLEENETDSPRQGVAEVYDKLDKSIIGTAETESDGRFSLQTTRPCLEAILQVRMEEGGTPKSYTGTITGLNGNQDYSNLTVKAKPHPDFDTDNDGDKDDTDHRNYREYLKNTNTYSGTISGLKKWDLEGKVDPQNALKGIGIFSTNPVSENGSSFTTGAGSQYETIKNKIKASDDIEVYVRGSNLTDLDFDGFPDLDNFILSGEPQEGIHYTIIDSTIAPKPGYILVAPDNSIINAGETSVGYYQNSCATGIMNRALIKINPVWGVGSVMFERAISHDFKHAFNSPHDIDPDGSYTDGPDLLPDLTILRYDTSLTKPGEADQEDSYIINEDAYSPIEPLSYIMNLGFLREGTGEGYDLE